jgi:hypothetical protein
MRIKTNYVHTYTGVPKKEDESIHSSLIYRTILIIYAPN